MLRTMLDGGCTLRELDVLLLVYRGRFVIKQVARRWGVSVNAIPVWLNHLRKKGLVHGMVQDDSLGLTPAGHDLVEAIREMWK